VDSVTGWSRSIVVLAVTFVSALAITMALVLLIVQDRGASTATDPDATPPATITANAAPMQTGGSLAVSGDREGTFTLDRDSYEVSIAPDFERGFARVEYGRFGLDGERGAIVFSTDPLAVEQIDLDGLAFYPDPDACTITPGELNPAIGVASARLQCASLTDLRDAGTISLDGAVALPADLLGMRGELPPSGGQVPVGSETLEFSDGRLLVQQVFTEETQRQALFLFGADEKSSLGFERDPETEAMYLTYIVIDEELFDIADDACTVSDVELGPLNPFTTVMELSIACDGLDLGSHGVVSIDATLVVDLIFESEALAAGA
jgi:hypothetical protein